MLSFEVGQSVSIALTTEHSYDSKEGQVSVVALKDGVADEASAAHCQSPAAVPNASFALGDQVSSVVEMRLEPVSLETM